MSEVNRKYAVYKHTTISGKVYIGITSRNPIIRWSNGRGYIRNKHFFRAILKYGWNNIKHEILYSEMSENEAKNKEVELIALYDSTNPEKGYNITKGGDSRAPLSEYSKYLVSTHNKGKIRTPIQIQHYIEAARKRPKRLYLSEEHKKNISKSLIGNKRAAGLTCNRKAVLQYNLDGRLLAIYNHAAEAAEIVGCDKSGINRACRENKSSSIENTKYKGKYKGFIWHYA